MCEPGSLIAIALLLGCARASPPARPTYPQPPPVGWSFEAKDYCVPNCPASAQVTQPRLRGSASRSYPEQLRRVHIGGLVTIVGTVDDHGRVVSTIVLQGVHPKLDAAAISDVEDWQFEPARCEDLPVASEFSVTLRYTP